MNSFEVTSFLADSVDLVQGKIYALGIGWDSINGNNFPIQHSRIGLGILITVPFTETNKDHQLQITLVDQDGNLVNNIKFQSQFKLGRPPQLLDGDSQVLPFAINFDGLIFASPSKYRWVIEIDGVVLGGNSIRVSKQI